MRIDSRPPPILASADPLLGSLNGALGGAPNDLLSDLGGSVPLLGDVVNLAADPLYTSGFEAQAMSRGFEGTGRLLAELRAQSDLDRILAPYEREGRPAGPPRTAISVAAAPDHLPGEAASRRELDR